MAQPGTAPIMALSGNKSGLITAAAIIGSFLTAVAIVGSFLAAFSLAPFPAFLLN